MLLEEPAVPVLAEGLPVVRRVVAELELVPALASRVAVNQEPEFPEAKCSELERRGSAWRRVGVQVRAEG